MLVSRMSSGKAGAGQAGVGQSGDSKGAASQIGAGGANARPWMSVLGWRRQAPLVGGFLILLIVAGALIWLITGSRNHNALVAHTLQVRSTAYEVLISVQGAETGQRGFLLTGNEAYLAPYHAGVVNAPKALAALSALTHDSPSQDEDIDQLGRLVSGKLSELAETIARARAGDTAGAVDLVRKHIGNNLMQQIREAIAAIQGEEERMLRRENTQTSTYGILLGFTSLAGIATVIALAAFTLAASRRSTLELLGAQDELRVANENLEMRVTARVADLQAANEEIQRFAYIVSHDLRAPLVNVMGFTSELESARAEIADFMKTVEAQAPNLVTHDCRVAIETDLPEALGFIRTSTAKMDRLINAILRLSREGRRVLTPQPIDLGSLLIAQRSSLSHQMAENNTEILIAADLPDLVSDRLAIEQIFSNLMENAVKYLARDRPGRIEVRGKKIGAFLRYEIIDNGRGIDRKDYERIFELFRRSGEQDKPGEGIGLAHVRNLVRRLGGNIGVTSELGKGSTFTITLPAVFSNQDRSS